MDPPRHPAGFRGSSQTKKIPSIHRPYGRQYRRDTWGFLWITDDKAANIWRCFTFVACCMGDGRDDYPRRVGVSYERGNPVERFLKIDKPLVRIHSIIEMMRRTGLAPWELLLPFSGSLTSTFLGQRQTIHPTASEQRENNLDLLRTLNWK